MADRLKREFIELLEKDNEFRYLVAGYLGYLEILKRLDILHEDQNKIWQEIRSLREGQEKLWEGQNKLWENNTRLWEEVKNLRMSQEKLWEEVTRLREGQEKLWEGQNKLWEEVKILREEQNKLFENYEKMRKYMLTGFRELRMTLGVTFEEYSAGFLEMMLVEMGYSEARVEKKYLVHDGEVIEINLFCEKPLVVGEVTMSIRTIDEINREMEKLLKRVEIIEKKYGEKPLMLILSVARPAAEISESLKVLAEKNGVKLIIGREIEELLS